MITTFKYNGKIITTPNLEKKLKRMKISLDDVEIIPIKEKSQPQGWEFEGIKEWRYFTDPVTKVTHCCLQDIGANHPKEYFFKDLMWNGKTGVRKITNEYVNRLYESTLWNND